MFTVLLFLLRFSIYRLDIVIFNYDKQKKKKNK